MDFEFIQAPNKAPLRTAWAHIVPHGDQAGGGMVSSGAKAFDLWFKRVSHAHKIMGHVHHPPLQH